MRRLLFAIALSATTSHAAIAAAIDAPSRIESVVVYPDGAMVTRSASFSVPAGTSTLILRGLGPTLDVASIRVQGEADGPITIGTVEMRRVPGDPRPAADSEIERKLDALRAERDMVAGRIEALDLKKKAIQRFAQFGPERYPSDPKLPEIATWPAVWDALADGMIRANDALGDLKAQAKRLDADIVTLERGRTQGGVASVPRRDVEVAVESAVPAKGRLMVSYRVSGASWTPLYDARLETGGKDRSPALELTRRALVSQRTGEDWSDVALTVSTVRANRGTAAPELSSLLMNLIDPQVYAAPASAPRSAAKGQRAPDAAVAMEERGAAPAVAAAPPQPAVEQMAQIESGSFQASFKVAGTVSVPADSTPKSLVLSRRNVQPVISARVAPALDETAYLDAAFTHDEDAPLLPGEVVLNRDGMFVGRGRFGLTPPGEKVGLGFGADDRVRVSRVPVRKRENDPSWVGSTKTELREFKTTVANLHDRAMRITVVDQIPVSENGAIVVEPLNLTPPTEKSVGDKRGVMAWSWDYAPGEQKEIKIGWRMKWPSDRELIVQEPSPIPLRR